MASSVTPSPQATPPASQVPPVNPELENIFSQIDNLKQPEQEQKKPKVDITHSLSETISKLSIFASRKSGLQSVAINEEDAKELEDALEPLMDDLAKYIDILPYLPLVIFVIGYVAGIIGEIMQRRKEIKGSPLLHRHDVIQATKPKETVVPASPKPIEHQDTTVTVSGTNSNEKTNSEATVTYS